MTKDEVLKWLKGKGKLAPFDNIEKCGKVNDTEVYAFTNSSEETLFIGLPQFVVVEKNEPRIVFGDEAFKIMDMLDLK